MRSLDGRWGNLIRPLGAPSSEGKVARPRRPQGEPHQSPAGDSFPLARGSQKARCSARGPHPSASLTPSPEGKVARPRRPRGEPHQSPAGDSFPLTRGSQKARCGARGPHPSASLTPSPVGKVGRPRRPRRNLIRPFGAPSPEGKVLGLDKRGGVGIY